MEQLQRARDILNSIYEQKGMRKTTTDIVPFNKPKPTPQQKICRGLAQSCELLKDCFEASTQNQKAENLTCISRWLRVYVRFRTPPSTVPGLFISPKMGIFIDS